MFLLIKHYENYIDFAPTPFTSELDEIRKLIDCKTIDIVTRSFKTFNIPNKKFCFIVDDEGLLNNKPLTLRSMHTCESIVGDMLICSIADDDIIGLSKFELEELIKHFIIYGGLYD